ncbi:MAG TPA: SMP-30/gluconolactonase/LRE family protein, partial [Chloroflexota bacterium]|nr:SMP-30/gluconolactonase/LRE family protein [Chloroflexota bacterium]
PAFWHLVARDAVLEHLATGFRTTEGPVWRGDHLLFTDIPRSRIVRWQMLPEGPEVRTFRAPTDNANGLTLDRAGRLICCEHTTRRVTRLDQDGTVTVLADRFKGKRLNSPNDVIAASNGAIYFTDPPYGLPNGSVGKELDVNGVFRIDPDGGLALVAWDCDRPNGLCFSPDERILYVADTPGEHVRAYDLQADGTLANSRIFADMASPEIGRPDGMKVDRDGRLYCTGGGGVRVVSPDGTKLGLIKLPEQCRNVTFGDDDAQALYSTAGGSLYRIRLLVPGIGAGV